MNNTIRTTEAKGKKKKSKVQETKQPCISYETARIMVRMYDFIMHANRAKRSYFEDLEKIVMIIQRIKKEIAPVKDPNQWTINYDYIDNDLENLRHDAWEMGLTHTLFEKLKDNGFRDRFVGFMPGPVLKEEIEDRYSQEIE